MSSFVLVITGRQNVGKSTLYNRLTKTRKALVANYPGLSRDRHYGQAQYKNNNYLVVDTGGFTTEKSDPFSLAIINQIQIAVSEANLVYLLVDARVGLHPEDNEFAKFLRKHNSKVVVVINKAEGLASEIMASEFYKLGFGKPIAISAEHGDNISYLLENTLTQENTIIKNHSKKVNSNSKQHLKIAIVGKPNVGKSTLINSIIGKQQLIVSDIPGTTRSSIEVELNYSNLPSEYQKIILIDTAGVRKKGKINDLAEKFSVIKTLENIEKAQVVIFTLDSSQIISSQEANLAQYIISCGKAMVVVFNKWDLLNRSEKTQYQKEYDRKLFFLKFTRALPISAKKKQGIDKMMKAVFEANKSANINLPTNILNNILKNAIKKQAPPYSGRYRPKLRYAHQGGKNPPIIIVHGNSTNKITDDYRRYLQNCFSSVLKLTGTPIIIKFKNSTNPFNK